MGAMTTGTFLGCDTDALRDTARLLGAASARAEAAAAELAASGAALAWEGPDADAFRDVLAHRAVAGLARLAAAWRAAAVTLCREAEDQDATSAPSAASGPSVPSAASISSAASARRPIHELLERLLPLDDGPSRGFFTDLAGTEAGPELEHGWVGVTQKSALAGMGIGRAGRGPLGSLRAVATDRANMGIGFYEASQGVRDGDALRVADGVTTWSLSAADGLANALELTPLAPMGRVVSPITGAAVWAWAEARDSTLADPDAQGSPSRHLLRTPIRLEEEVIRPLAERLPEPIGEPLGRAGAIGSHAAAAVEDIDDLIAGRWRGAIDGTAVDDVLSLPRRSVEAPRHAVEAWRQR